MSPTLHCGVFRPETDLERVLEMLSRGWTASGPGAGWHVGDVCWWQRRDIGARGLIWEDAEGQLAGFSSRDEHGYFEILVTPERVAAVEYQQMVRDLESQPILPLDDPEIEVGSRTMVREDDAKTRAYLEHDGYRITEITKVHMLRALDGPVDPADVVNGFHIRSLAGEAEITPRLTVHIAAALRQKRA